jgi:hypothetical protein
MRDGVLKEMGYGKHLANACYTEAFTHYRVATKLRTKL